MVLRAAVARPGAGRRADRHARPHVRRPAHPRPRTGHGKVEFDGFRVDMATARQQFKESAEAIFDALETGVMEYARRVRQPAPHRAAPGARTPSFKGRTYSATDLARVGRDHGPLGTGVLVVPQKPWHLVQEEMAEVYRDDLPRGHRRGAAGADRGRLDLRRRERRPGRGAGPHVAVGGYWDSVIAHYEFDKPHLKSTPGYEFHGQMYDRLNEPGGAREDDRVLRRPAAVGAPPSRCTRRSPRSATWSAATATSACSATAACRPTRPSAACACSPAEVMPELKTLEPGDRTPRARQGLIALGADALIRKQ